MSNIILIIDDDPDILDSVSTVLEASGFQTVTAGGYREALERAEEVAPDLVLCDMMMEEVDSGTKTAGAIRDKYPSIPVYLLSSIGNATAQTIEVGTLGFDGVLQKPVHPDVLVRVVRRALRI